jgi:hypothetical protein
VAGGRPRRWEKSPEGRAGPGSGEFVVFLFLYLFHIRL